MSKHSILLALLGTTLASAPASAAPSLRAAMTATAGPEATTQPSQIRNLVPTQGDRESPTMLVVATLQIRYR